MIRSFGLISVVTFLTACATTPKYPALPADHQAIFEEAEKTYRESHADRFELAKAQDLYRKVLLTYPRHAPSILGIGKVAKRLGYINGLNNYDPEFVKISLIFFDRALEIDPYFANALAAKATAYLSLHDPKSASVWLEKAKSANSKAPAVLDASAIFHIETKNYAQALADTDRGINLASELHWKTSFLDLRSEIYGSTGQHDLMIKSRLETANLKPQDHWTLGNVAYSYSIARNWEQCASWAEKALNIQNYSMARHHYSYCSIMNGKLDQALNMKWQAPLIRTSNKNILSKKEFQSTYSPSIGSLPENVFQDLYKSYEESQMAAATQQDFETATKFHSISFYLAEKKQFKESISWLEKALKLTPKSFEIADDRIRITIYALQDKINGLKMIDESLSIKRTPKQTAKLLVYKAQLLCSEKKTESCANMAMEALQVDPSNEYAYPYIYGSLLDDLKRPDLLIKFQKKMEENERNITPSYLQWKAYFTIVHLKNHNRAEELLARAIQIDPNYSMAYYRLAFVHYERGEFDKSLDTINFAISKGLPNKFIGYAGILKGSLLFTEGQKKKSPELMDEAIKAYADVVQLEPENQNARDGYMAAKRALASIKEK